MLSTKKLIYKICEWITNNKTVTFTGTLGTGMQDGTLNGTYDPSSGVVTISFSCRKSSDITTNDALFTIPEEYRPSAAKYIPAVINTSSATSMYRAQVATTGVITQALTSSARGVHGSGSYTI